MLRSPVEIFDRVRAEGVRQKYWQMATQLAALGVGGAGLRRYLVVGEAGAGKTEALRHSGLEYPKVIQDPTAMGGGGTVNVDFWITKQAIFMDSAGRILLERGNKEELAELLRLVRRSRPTCPLDAVLLAIPADTLLHSTDDRLTELGHAFRDAFVMVQQVLSQRARIHVLVTKCDLIPGFRLFAKRLCTSPLRRHAIAWRNPRDDGQFDPDEFARVADSLRFQLEGQWHWLNRELSPPPPGTTPGRQPSVPVFPANLVKVLARAVGWAGAAFRPAPSGVAPQLRGLYLTSALWSGDPATDCLGGLVEDVEDNGAGAAYISDDGGGWFLNGVFQDHVLLDAADRSRLHRSAGGHLADAASWCRGRVTELLIRGRGRATRNTRWDALFTSPVDLSRGDSGGRDFDVFLCYNSCDRDRVIALARQLESRGIRPWMDAWNVEPGEDFVRALPRALRSARAVLVVFGPGGLTPWMNIEVSFVFGQCNRPGKLIIPVVLEGVADEQLSQSEIWSFLLHALQRVDLRSNGPNAIDRMCRTLIAHIAKT